jgi:aspartate aminotransferase
MTGWRIGYAAASEELTKLMSNIQSHTTSNPNSIAQYASVAALKGDSSAMDVMVAEFKRRRDYMVKKVNSIDGLSCIIPEGAFYVMVNISKVFGKKSSNVEIKDSMSFSEELLNKEKVAVIPGIGFGIDEYVRLSYATSMLNIEKGLDRIDKFVKQLKG